MKSILMVGAVAAAFAGVQSHAASQAQWAVTGTITPPACSLLLSGEGVANFGELASSQVQRWTATGTPARYISDDAKEITLSVNCGMPTRFALYVADNRADSVVGPTIQADKGFGLGHYTAPGEAPVGIGRYTVNYDGLMIQTAAGGEFVYPAAVWLTNGQATSTSTWSLATSTDRTWLSAGKSLGFSPEASSTTQPIVAVQGPLRFHIEPQKSVVDNALTNVVFQGSATVTLVGL